MAEGRGVSYELGSHQDPAAQEPELQKAEPRHRGRLLDNLCLDQDVSMDVESLAKCYNQHCQI